MQKIRCKHCGREKTPDEFYDNKNKANGKDSHCMMCRGKMARTLDIVSYGLTQLEYDRLLEKQKGMCAICGNEMQKPHIDHDHATGVIRGLLCHHCNTALGNFRDDVGLLRKAISYLQEERPAPSLIQVLAKYQAGRRSR